MFMMKNLRVDNFPNTAKYQARATQAIARQLTRYYGLVQASDLHPLVSSSSRQQVEASQRWSLARLLSFSLPSFLR